MPMDLDESMIAEFLLAIVLPLVVIATIVLIHVVFTNIAPDLFQYCPRIIPILPKSYWTDP